MDWRSSHSSNRTFMELKFCMYTGFKDEDGNGSNRTFMELK